MSTVDRGDILTKDDDRYGVKLQDTFKSVSVAVLLAGTLLTLMVSAWALHVAADTVRSKFDHISDSYIAQCRTYLTDQEQELSAIQRSIEVLDAHFDGKAFHRLVSPVLRFPGLQKIAWVPVVPYDQRAAQEAAAVQEGLNGYTIKELTTEGTFRVAGRRDTYFPLQYIEPLQSDERLAGFDLGSNATRFDAITRAIKSGLPQASGRITMLQEKNNRHGFILAVPVRSSTTHIRGLVVAAYRADVVLENSLASTNPAGFDILLTDLSAPPGESELTLHRSRLKLDKSIYGVLASLLLPQLENDHALDFAGRRWNIAIKATPGFLQQNAQLGGLGILPVGMLISLGLSLFLHRKNNYIKAIAASEEVIRQKDHFARCILDGLNLNICVIDQQGTIVATNRAWHEFAEETNAAPGTCSEGSNYLHAILENSAGVSTIKADLTAVLDDTLSELCRDYPCHSPEIERWFSCRANSFKVGESTYAVVSHEDITWRKKTELELRKLSRIIEESPISVVITDLFGTIEYVNPMFTRITGYSAAEAIGQNSRIVQSGNTPPETYKKLWSTILAGNTWEGEFANKSKDGRLFYESATISALRDSDGSITHFLGVKKDITENKNLTEQLVHSQKLESIGELAGGLAHDMNNILSVINGYATLVLPKMESDQKQHKYIMEILAASERAGALSHSLLAYSRKQVMNQHKEDLKFIVGTVSSFIKRILHDNIMFAITLADEPLTVFVDQMQIEQVLLNLATNARDAMPEGGTFTIATAAGSMDEQFIATHGFGTIGRYAIITVTDSGHGMDAETIHKVFDPFFTTKEVGKGTGLGLSMVMGIIKQHGGFIGLHSQPGKGCVFQLYLPLVADGNVSAPITTDYQMVSGSGTILVAEDDPDTLILLEELLLRAGYTVITAIDGQDAVEKFARQKDEIALVISDVVMPRKSGKAASDEIRKMSAATKFIFVSGHAAKIIEEEGFLGTVTEHAEIILKPILPFVLLQKIREMLASPSPDV